MTSNLERELEAARRLAPSARHTNEMDRLFRLASRRGRLVRYALAGGALAACAAVVAGLAIAPAHDADSVQPPRTAFIAYHLVDDEDRINAFLNPAQPAAWFDTGDTIMYVVEYAPLKSHAVSGGNDQ